MNNTLKKELPSFRQASREVVRELGMFKAHSDYGISCTQVHILIEIGKYGVITAKDLANIVEMDKSTASRSINPLITDGFVKSKKSHLDSRVKLLTLTKKGFALLESVNSTSDFRVEDALESLEDNDLEIVLKGMSIYASALKKSRIKEDVIIRLIKKSDNVQVASLIKNVILEFGQPVETTVSIIPEVNYMYEFYQEKRSSYFVLESNGQIVGGVGVASLKGADENMCELQKMYILPEYRGLGLGKSLLDRAISQAKDYGYKFCYLDTLQHMARAVSLYTKNGFKKINKNISKNNHHTCNTYFMKKL